MEEKDDYKEVEKQTKLSSKEKEKSREEKEMREKTKRMRGKGWKIWAPFFDTDPEPNGSKTE